MNNIYLEKIAGLSGLSTGKLKDTLTKLKGITQKRERILNNTSGLLGDARVHAEYRFNQGPSLELVPPHLDVSSLKSALQTNADKLENSQIRRNRVFSELVMRKAFK